MTGNIPDRDFLNEHSEQVYSLFWDSGNPGVGAEAERIYRYAGQFFVVLSFEDEVTVYPSLAEALKGSELYELSETSEALDFSEEYVDVVLSMLTYSGEQVKTVLINKEEWIASPEDGFQRNPAR